MSGTGEIVQEVNSVVTLVCLFSAAVPAGRPSTQDRCYTAAQYPKETRGGTLCKTDDESTRSAAAE